MAEQENKNYLTYILVGLLVVAAFAIGSLYTRVKYLEKGAVETRQEAEPTKPVAKYQSFDEALKDYAKQIEIDPNKFISCVNTGEKKATVEADLTQGEKLKVSGTPLFFLNGRMVNGAFPYEAFKEIIDKELAGSGSTNFKDYSQLLQQAYEDPRGKLFDPVPKEVAVGNAPIVGSADAKVTIVEFSDFQCPFCARSYPTMKKVLADYAGKVRLVYKHFPLNSIHFKAQKAAEASECTKDQGKFWEFHDKLFENQTEWTGL